MPAERNSVYPHVTPEQWEAIKAETSPAVIAARSIAVTKFGGSIPARAFLTGENDHSPLMRGLIQYTTAVHTLMAAMEEMYAQPDASPMPAAWEDHAGAVYEMMEGPDGLR